MSTGKIHELIIVGSGPAGYTAALYAARANLKPILFEGTEIGGSLATTTEVENFPGFPAGIQGPELMMQMREQAEKFGAELISENIVQVDLSKAVKILQTDGDTYQAKAVILAMGAAPQYLQVPGEQELLGRGVSACATCDGFFFKDQDIAVVGGGDSAMEEATFLTKFANKVSIIHRRDGFRASKIMLDRAKNNPKIEFVTNKKVAKVNGSDKVESVELIDTLDETKSTLPVTGFFLAIGHIPRSELVANQVELTEKGFIKTKAPSSYTNIPGVFAAGDIADEHYQQAVTAAGSGCTAAIDAERWLADQESQL